MAMARSRWSALNLPNGAAEGAIAARRARVEVEDAERLVRPLHRHADDLAHAEAHDALHRLEALVAGRVRDEHALLRLQDVFHDRAADRHLFLLLRAVAPAQRLRLKLLHVQRPVVFGAGRVVGGGVPQHDAAAVGVEMAEDQVHDAVEQLIEVENVADGLDGLVDDAEVGSAARGPRPGRGG